MSGQTRREWMLTISQAAVTAAAVPGSFCGPATPHTLPSGLYLPSTDHLSLALMSADQYHAIPPGCPTDYVRPSTEPLKPAAFSAEEFRVIHRLVQLMLGEPENDAAVSQEVAQWIDLYVASAQGIHEGEMHLAPLHRALAPAFYGKERDGVEEDPLAICREGIRWILDVARAQYSKDFLQLSADHQTAILHSISDEARPRNENTGNQFFDFLKVETIRGFYTSRAGLKELNFKGNAYYTRSPGCNSK